jgi:hypothetical protein
LRLERPWFFVIRPGLPGAWLHPSAVIAADLAGMLLRRQATRSFNCRFEVGRAAPPLNHVARSPRGKRKENRTCLK